MITDALTEASKTFIYFAPGMILIALLITDTVLTFAGLKLGYAEANPQYAHYNVYGVTSTDFFKRFAMGLIWATAYWISAGALRKGHKNIIFAMIVSVTTLAIIAELIVVLLNAINISDAITHYTSLNG